MSQRFPKDHLDRRPDRAKGIGGDAARREDLLLTIEEQHEAVAWHQGRGDLAKTVQDIPLAPDP